MTPETGAVRIRHARRWSPVEIFTTVKTLLLAAVVEGGVRFVRVDRLALWLGVRMAAERDLHRGQHAGTAGAPGARVAGRLEPDGWAGLDESERVACRAVARVMAHWPGRRGTCLREALLYGYALRRRRPRLHIGAVNIDGRMLAHAWLSYDGGKLGVRPGVHELTAGGR